MENLILEEGNLFLSYAFLYDYIAKDAVMDWPRLGRKKYDCKPYFNYKYIPKPSKSKLPIKDILFQNAIEAKKDIELIGLEVAKDTGFVKYMPYYQAQDIPNDKVKACAIKRAVWEYICHTHVRYNNGQLSRFLEAYQKLFPDQYSGIHAFSKALKEAKNDIEGFVLHGNLGNKNASKLTPIHQKLIVDTQLTNPTASQAKIHVLVNEVLRLNGLVKIGSTSVKNLLKTHETTLHETLKGQVEGRKRKAFMPLAKVPYANNQWQMDGWTLPFYYKEDGKLKKLWLITVMDAHSRKIVGYHIDTSERLTSIKQALDNAIKETQSFAFELVSDNHSANETSELKGFQNELENLGVTFTVDSNPQRKGKLERLFQVMDSEYFRYETGWVGEGVKSKRKNARPKPEILDKYLSNALEKNQIIQTAIRIVETYNNAPRKVLGNVSPNHAYNTSEKPNSIVIDDLKRIQLTTKPKHYKVNRGMIKVVRGVTERYFGYLEQWEGETLEVFTANDYESIYATDPKTGKLVAELPQISRMHPDLASQTHEDLEEKARYARHIKAVKKQREDALLDLGNKAKKQTDLLGIPADAFNPLTHKKHQQLDPDIQHRINRKLSEEYDIDPEMTPEPEHKSDAAIERAFALINVVEKPQAKELNKKGSYLPVDINKYRE